MQLEDKVVLITGAGMAVFLTSPAARNITGQAYDVDGGLVTS